VREQRDARGGGFFVFEILEGGFGARRGEEGKKIRGGRGNLRGVHKWDEDGEGCGGVVQ